MDATDKLSSEALSSLAELCIVGMVRRITKGRPRKLKAKKEKPIPTQTKKAGWKRREERSGSSHSLASLLKRPASPRKLLSLKRFFIDAIDLLHCTSSASKQASVKLPLVDTEGVNWTDRLPTQVPFYSNKKVLASQ